MNVAVGATGRVPKFDRAMVSALAKSSKQQGDPSRGAAIFKSIRCISCHRIGNDGGRIGPNLTSIGTTLSAERIVEEVLWPERQVKEGYSILQVVTTSGQVHQGFEQITRSSQKSGNLIIRELDSDRLRTIHKDEIDAKQLKGTPMPTGLTATLSKSQLRDLLAFLFGLGAQ